MLSDKEILHQWTQGAIVIEPFVRSRIGTNSVDVCLGEYFYRENAPDPDYQPRQIFNPYSYEDVMRVWGPDYCEAPYRDHIFPPNEDMANIKDTDRVIMLAPGETILAHTKEFIGGRYQYTTMMKARSSFGRSFIEVCKCAGLGDVGYINRWTMEVTNNSRYYHIPLVVGRRIAQITFYNTGKTLKDYAVDGKYQGTDDLQDLIKNWKPEMMLPRLYDDRELR